MFLVANDNWLPFKPVKIQMAIPTKIVVVVVLINFVCDLLFDSLALISSFNN